MEHAGQAIGGELPRDDLLATKLFRPAARQDLVHRPRLTGRLAAELAPLTVIIAPAGWGKTSLIVDWLASQADPATSVAWLALDERDNDLNRFLRYLIGAVQTAEPELGRPALTYLDSAQLAGAEAVLTLLLNELAALTHDLALVLDDYHTIETPAIHQVLTFLLDHVPPRLHLVIATRHDPPLPLARLRARGRLSELRAEDLAFTAQEARAFLNGAMGLELSASDVAALGTRTEGWIAGLHLAALSMRQQDTQHRHDFITALGGTNRYILDYLAGEVFDRQPPEVQRFLLYTSILGGLSGPLCDAVLGGATAGPAALVDGQTMLERLDEANLFVVRLDDTRTWYRYHHLFAQFLRERLRREEPDLVPELHRRACRWLEASGRPAYAAEHALRAEDFDEAARLIERAIPPLIWQRGEMMTLQRWLERLPRTAIRTRPRLSLDFAWAALWSAQLDAVEPRLQDAERTLTDHHEPDSRALRGEVAAIRAELARRQGEVDAAITMARQALADLPKDAHRVRGATSGLLGQAELVQGDAAAAARAFSDAAVLGRAPGTLALALIAHGRLLQTQVLQGKLRVADATYRQIAASAETDGMSEGPPIGVAQVYAAEVCRERNDLAEAEKLVRQGIARCLEWAGLADMALDGYATLARLLEIRGDTDEALAVLIDAEHLGRDAHVNDYVERLDLARARLWLRRGDEVPLTRWMDARQDTRREGQPLRYVPLLERVMLARLYLARNRPDDALAILEGLLERAEAGGLAACAVEILTLRALSLRARGQTAPAMLALTRALSMAEPEGYVRLFLDEGQRMVRLLREARSRGVAPAYLDALLASADTASAPAGGIDGLVEPLSERELELLRLLASGLSTEEIADRLFITTGTVRNHLKNIFGKLDVHSRVQAIERARALSLL